MPAANNLYGVIETRMPKPVLAAIFRASGWEVRACSWADFELRSPDAELVLEGDQPLLLHGAVREIESNAENLAVLLRRAGLTFSLELFGSDGDLLRTLTSG